jgi:23S rRNA (adenine2503-C2)-methyltransferase
MKNYQDTQEIFKKHGIPSFRVRQLFDAVFGQGITEYEKIPVFSAELKQTLSGIFPLLSLKPVRHLVSSDGFTEKVAFSTVSGEMIEAVLMKYQDGRNSICISSQAGCPMGCLFCATGAGKFFRNLNYEEISDQVLYFHSQLKQTGQSISNVVYMGMGEPFLNYEQVMKSIHLLNDPDGLNLAARRITVSTCGIVEGIDKLARENLQINLAISLHAPTQGLREKIMPVAKRSDLASLRSAIKSYCDLTNRRVSFEYVMLRGINDRPEDARELAEISRNKLIHINLIPYNETNINGIQGSTPENINAFKNILQKAGVNVTVRVTMGQDIAAACGQLANNN